MFENLFGDNPGMLIPVIAVGGGVLVAIVAIVVGVVHSIANTKEKERSRREIAAYIAEGSMTSEQGERLIKANPDE
jgi:hypothetical protein